MMLQLRCSVAAGAGAGAAEAASSCRRRWPRRRAASAAAGAAAGEASARRPRRRSRGTGLPRSPDRRCSGTATAAICTPNKTRRQQATHTQLARRLAREGTHEGNPMRIRTCGCLGPNGNGSWWATRKTAGGGGGSIWVWGCLELASSCAGHRTRWLKRDKACFIRQHFTRHASLMRNARPNGYLCFRAPGRGRLPVDVERHGDALVRGLVFAAAAAAVVKAAPFVPRRAPQRQVQVVVVATAARRRCTAKQRTVRACL
jgi:hypothetical protein